MKKLISLFLTLMLVMTLSPACFAAETVAEQIAGLPTVEEFKTMDQDAQLDAYNRTQAAYDAYMALSEEEKAAIPGAEDTFESLFGYFNTLVQPIEQAQSQEEPGFGSNLIATVLAVAIALAVLPMFVKKRRGI